MVAAVWVHRTLEVRAARRVAAWGSAFGLAGSAAAAVHAGAVPLAGAPPVVTTLFAGIIGITAVLMSPVRDTRPDTFGRILLLQSCTAAFAVSSNANALAALWALAPLLVWLELRSREESRPAARVFAMYMVPSIACFALGAGLLQRGETAAAVALVAVAIAFREAVIPLHSWLPLLFERAPMGVAVAFVAPQIGVHAHLLLLADHLSPSSTALIASIGALTALYGAAMGVAQTRTRRALGYLLMSQSGLVAFGLDTGGEVARAGTLVAWWVVGVAVAAFAMATAALEARRGELSLLRPSGTFARVPRLAAAFLVTGLASVGLPGTLGFVAEDLLVQGSIDPSPILAFVLIIATALNGITVVRNFFLLFTGSTRHAGEQDLRPREVAALTLVLVTLLSLGVFPRLLLDRATGTAEPDVAISAPVHPPVRRPPPGPAPPG
jgi:NADH-quinone oxidoreductase subunit M